MSGNRVLVAVASRHGGTVGVAEAVADGPRQGLGSGAVVGVRPVAELDDGFTGRLDRAGRGPAERAVAGLLLLREGNRRDPATHGGGAGTSWPSSPPGCRGGDSPRQLLEGRDRGASSGSLVPCTGRRPVGAPDRR